MTEALGFVTAEFRGLTHFPSRDADRGLRWGLTTLAGSAIPVPCDLAPGASSWLSILGTRTLFKRVEGKST